MQKLVETAFQLKEDLCTKVVNRISGSHSLDTIYVVTVVIAMNICHSRSKKSSS